MCTTLVGAKYNYQKFHFLISHTHVAFTILLEFINDMEDLFSSIIFISLYIFLVTHQNYTMSRNVFIDVKTLTLTLKCFTSHDFFNICFTKV